jgi:hypothetical protein
MKSFASWEGGGGLFLYLHQVEETDSDLARHGVLVHDGSGSKVKVENQN